MSSVPSLDDLNESFLQAMPQLFVRFAYLQGELESLAIDIELMSLERKLEDVRSEIKQVSQKLAVRSGMPLPRIKPYTVDEEWEQERREVCARNRRAENLVKTALEREQRILPAQSSAEPVTPEQVIERLDNLQPDVKETLCRFLYAAAFRACGDKKTASKKTEPMPLSRLNNGRVPVIVKPALQQCGVLMFTHGNHMQWSKNIKILWRGGDGPLANWLKRTMPWCEEQRKARVAAAPRYRREHQPMRRPKKLTDPASFN